MADDKKKEVVKKDTSTKSVNVSVKKEAETPKDATIEVRNRKFQKMILHFPLGRTVTFKPRGVQKLTRAEIESDYFAHRKKYFTVKGG